MTGSSDAGGLFSPGPWWGFNGVRRLRVADDYLVISPVGGWKSGRKERRIPLSDVAAVSRRTRHGLFGRPDVLTAKLRIDGKAVTFTAKDPADGRVLDDLFR